MAMTISRTRSRRSGLAHKRFGLAGYTVLWTLSFWLAGDIWAALPTFFIAYPIAQGVQRANDRLRRKIFS